MARTRYYKVAPPDGEYDFKSLFRYAVDRGAGLPCDKDSQPIGSWSPDLFSDVATELDPKGVGVNLRTCQYWFGVNDRATTAKQVEIIARVFGRGNPDNILHWRVKLNASIQTKRIKDKALSADTRSMNVPIIQVMTESNTPRYRQYILSLIQIMFSVDRNVQFLMIFWTCYGILGFLNFIGGVMDVSYEPVPGIMKQIGFIWDPTLSVLPLLILPLFMIAVSDFCFYWINIHNDMKSPKGMKRFHEALKPYTSAFVVLFSICFLFVFLLQWMGIYLPVYLSGQIGENQVDRYLLHLPDTNAISLIEVVGLSLAGYLFASVELFVFFSGLLLLYIGGRQFDGELEHRDLRSLKNRAFKVCVLALWFTGTIRLQTAYLSSDAGNIINWIYNDFVAMFVDNQRSNGALQSDSVFFFTTLLMVAIVLFAFFLFSKEYVRAYGTFLSKDPGQASSVRSAIVLTSIAVCILLIGVIPGFTVLLVLGGGMSLLFCSDTVLGRYL